MRKLEFYYEMQLQLDSDVTRHSFCLRCLPKQTPTQKIGQLSCEITPLNSITKTTDAFGNDLCIGYIEEPHDYFGFRVSGIAVTNSEYIEFGSLNPLYRYTTPQTLLTRGAEVYLRIAERMQDPIQKVLAMSDLLYKNFTYTPCSTTTTTTAQQALEQGCGVCQDYAHILIGLSRLCGIPARYIAGFMTGEGATHAWLEIYARGHWIGIDPTHNRVIDDKYVKLSEGRDAGDCIVDKGVFWGDATQKQTVLVKARELPL